MNHSIEKLERIVDEQIGSGNIQNVVVAIQSYDRNIDFIRAAGVADAGTGMAMTPDSPYFIASVSKTYTAAIILRLHEQRRLDLDQRITEYLSPSMTNGIHIYKGTDYSDQIKVYQLVDQTSGLPDHELDKTRGGKSVIDELKSGGDRAISTSEAIEIARGLTPRFPPGTPGKAHYSNTNYRLLGAIIETVTGKTMAENYAEMICVPLGLEKTYLYDWEHPRPGPQPATFFLKEEPAFVPKYLSSNVSDGGLVSTAGECLLFFRAFFEGQLFDKQLFDRMTNWNSMFFPMRYGYGMMYFQLPRFFWLRPLPEFIGHSGSTGSFAFTCPSRELYLVGTINQMASQARPFILMINLVRSLS